MACSWAMPARLQIELTSVTCVVEAGEVERVLAQLLPLALDEETVVVLGESPQHAARNLHACKISIFNKPYLLNNNKIC